MHYLQWLNWVTIFSCICSSILWRAPLVCKHKAGRYKAENYKDSVFTQVVSMFPTEFRETMGAQRTLA